MNDMIPAPTVVVPKMEPKPDPLIEAFRVEIASLCEGPLDAKTLHKILTTAQSAQQVLLLRNPRGVRRCNNGPGLYGGPWGVNMNQSAYELVDEGDASGPMPNPPVSPWQNTETFGATMVREIVSALRPPEQSMPDVVRALADARKLGMDDVAERLLATLQAKLASDMPSKAVGDGQHAVRGGSEALHPAGATEPSPAPVVAAAEVSP